MGDFFKRFSDQWLNQLSHSCTCDFSIVESSFCTLGYALGLFHAILLVKNSSTMWAKLPTVSPHTRDSGSSSSLEPCVCFLHSSYGSPSGPMPSFKTQLLKDQCDPATLHLPTSARAEVCHAFGGKCCIPCSFRGWDIISVKVAEACSLQGTNRYVSTQTTGEEQCLGGH